MAIVGLLASFLTASLVDELTDTPSDKNQEARGQGIANIVTAFFGGMAGCGMIGQSVINVQSGGRGRLSTLCAGIFLLFAILFLQDWVKQMPMAALVAMMIMVSIGTFRWSSLKNLPRIPRSETVVMLTTMAGYSYPNLKLPSLISMKPLSSAFSVSLRFFSACRVCDTSQKFEGSNKTCSVTHHPCIVTIA